jgi:hypothetical protein
LDGQPALPSSASVLFAVATRIALWTVVIFFLSATFG